MNEKNYTGAVPEQSSGVPIDTESSRSLNSETEAKAFYQTVRSRLLDVNNWNARALGFSADFQLVDQKGTPQPGPAKEGYLFRIDIPAPGSNVGEGYDWVRIEAVEEISEPGVESTAIRVRPTDNPTSDENKPAHFYSRQSTSTFTATREGNKVTIAIYDRNTSPNTEAGSITDKIRDAVVGAAGIISFSRLQWKSLAEGLLKEDG